MLPTANPFPGSTVTLLGSTTTYEPSGLALAKGKLYLASDDGYIYLYDHADNAWHEVFADKGADFESLTYSKGKLMAGVEKNKEPEIVRLAASSDGSLRKTSSWILELPKGVNAGDMEAMTFVPEEYCPFGRAKHYGGFFFAAFQSCLGKIFVYDLPKGKGRRGITGNKPICAYTVAVRMAASDMCFANGVLYVLFDDNVTTNILAACTTHRKEEKLTLQKQYGLPKENGSSSNYEGLAVDGQTIYLSRDDNAKPADNAVYYCPSTSIFPEGDLPSQNCD
ncbi:hypothetical protein GCAAIG_02630 [Candidatus Electronema halotolerans]